MQNPMNWTQLMSATRFYLAEDNSVRPLPAKAAEDYRSAYHVDYDRVVFCNAFRRLGRKTQVHPLAKNEHTHNRLAHSVEVASVGRSLGARAGGMLAAAGELPEHLQPVDIGTAVQVACLAHDLGNPPFGHTGEDALRSWFRQPENARFLDGLSDAERRDVQGYEGNAHSLRQIASLQSYRNSGGLRLTAASVGALLKYPWGSTRDGTRGKFNIYQTEMPYIRSVAAELGLLAQGSDCWARHPLSYLMEAADDICYALMDLEDAVDLGLLDAGDVESLFRRLAPAGSDSGGANSSERSALLRGPAIGRAVDEAAQTFFDCRHELLSGSLKAKDLLALCSDEVQGTLEAAKKLARERVFRHRSKLMYELASFPCLATILDALVPAVHSLLRGRPDVRQTLALGLLDNDPVRADDSLYAAYMKVLDFVGGMTDNYAARMARELSGLDMA